jgi:hypothetical protein
MLRVYVLMGATLLACSGSTEISVTDTLQECRSRLEEFSATYDLGVVAGHDEAVRLRIIGTQMCMCAAGKCTEAEAAAVLARLDREQERPALVGKPMLYRKGYHCGARAGGHSLDAKRAMARHFKYKAAAEPCLAEN